MGEGNLIEVRNLAVSFTTPAGPVQAVRDISFRIRRGSCVAIVGESGSGKSVSARAIMGILARNATIEQGSILFDDPATDEAAVDLAQLDPRSDAYRAVRGGRISIIFQEPMTSLSPVHTVGNQINEALLLHADLSAREAEARCIEMLGLVRFPDPKRAYKSYPFELSGGLRQRAMIAMALVCRPALLIADEPTTALDVTVQAQILALMSDLRQELDMAVLMITHDMGVVANVAEEVVVVYRGEIMESGMVEDVLENPQHPYLKALLGAVPTIEPGATRARLKPLRDIEPVIGHLLSDDHSGENLPARDDGVAATPADAAEPLLRVRELTKRFRIKKSGIGFAKDDDATITAVDRVSFDIEPGECLGLVGESGCGKTTVSKLIMGAMPADDGEIILHDHAGPVHLETLSDRALVPYRRSMQYIFQDPFGSLNPRMTVYDVLSEPLEIHGIGDQAYRDEMVREIMGLVGLDVRSLNRYPHSFSGGQRQRIGIARALVLKPRLLICDEPVSALDVSTQAQVLNLLNDLRDKLGLTYLFISHDLAVVNYIADRIAVMCRGQLVEIGPRDAIFETPQHPYTRSLLASVPTTDLDRPLDFSLIRDGLATQPENWPAGFAPRSDERPRLVGHAENHFVRKYMG
ncbi:MAG: ABC transporter ATP-binding protein [Pseudomonadota bacterium]